MADKKRVLVACGTGIATSTVVCKRVEDLLKNNGIEEQADLLVTTTIPSREYKIPVVKAVSYLTGMQTEKTDQEILSALQ